MIGVYKVSKYKKAISENWKTFKNLIPDILAVAGVVCISYGAYLFSKPIGFMTMGVLLIGGAYLWSKSE